MFGQNVSGSQQLVDQAFIWSMAIAVAIFIAVLGVIVWFLVKYNRKSHPVPEKTKENNLLEFGWTAATLVLFLALFMFGWRGYQYLQSAPSDSLNIEVAARQWSWSFIYPNGKVASELYVPVGRPVKLNVKSQDVVHGFFVPALRLKVDAVPGKENSVWFEAREKGNYDIECTVICGIQHSYMLSKLVVSDEDKFKKWYFGGEGELPPVP